MNDKQAEALGRRLVACEGFRWMPGMVARWTAPSGRPRWARIVGGMTPRDVAAWPDLRDPATLGCVLALVRERWPMAHVVPWAGIAPDMSAAARWRIMDARRRDLFPWSRCATEAEALVAALEAAT